jgi:cell division protein FtsB
VRFDAMGATQMGGRRKWDATTAAPQPQSCRLQISFSFTHQPPQAEAAISSFKAEQRIKYETMQREEQELGAQVAAMDANVERWAAELVERTARRGPGGATTSKPRKGTSHEPHTPERMTFYSSRPVLPRLPVPSSPSAARARHTSTKLTDKDVPREVAQYEHYLVEHGGLTGGWTDYDHGTFVHHRQKHRAQAPFFQAVAQVRKVVIRV